MTDLQLTWFLLVGILFAGYSVLDGIDSGVGTLLLGWGRSDEERRLALGSIGPATFGNEFWLVAGVAALFTAFPPVRGTILEAFLPLLAVFVLVLVLRAAALGSGRASEDVERPKSRDVTFGVLSVLAAFFPGLILGNVLRGLPLDSQGTYSGSPGDLLNPFALVLGLEVVALFALQGACWLNLRAGSELGERTQDTVLRAWVTVVAVHGIAGLLSLWAAPHLWKPYHHPLTWIAPVVMLVSLVAVPFLVKGGQARAALLASSTVIAALWAIVGQGLYPRIVPALGETGHSLTIANAAATPTVLTSLLVVLLAVLTLVAGYSVFAFVRFRRPVA
ncbi:MAG TPA: cytochrome d ubiquinol oxidase subunit II [Thermoanaerobaculia bacterium]|nr:cytochrome d ubiquinol oxidase subunit II [Thermoanaerobaculia bacterium]